MTSTGHNGRPDGGNIGTERPLAARAARWAGEFPQHPAYTFVDYSTDQAGVHHTLTWESVHRRACAVAARVRHVVAPGERAAILTPQGLDYVVAMLGTMYAGVIAVPVSSPDLPGHTERLRATFADCDPQCVLTNTAALQRVSRFLHEQPVPAVKEVIAVDEVDGTLADSWPGELPPTDAIAYLQYTSGSTRSPAGVEITHANMAANARQVEAAFIDGEPTLVSWLPLFHDMGLILTIALPLLYGNQAVFTDPMAFIMTPARWLRLLGEHSGVITAAPNFAYDYCVSRVPDRDKRGLDLSGVRVCVNAAEPVRAATVERFNAAFGDCGLAPEAHSTAYGLAEATVYVSAESPRHRSVVTAFDRDALAAGHAQPAAADDERASRLVSCGTPSGQRVAIVDPQTGVPLPAGQVGEIWVHGPNVARAYWRQPQRSAEVFAATMAQPGADAPAGPWLRTGDLGVEHEGALYVTGRLKDLVIVDGRNHYPQDIEATAQAAHTALRRDHLAAFAVPGEGGEGVVVVGERSTRLSATECDPVDVAVSVRRAVASQHDLRLYDFVLVEPASVPRTSSGKVARRACRQLYLDGKFDGPAGRQA